MSPRRAARTEKPSIPQGDKSSYTDKQKRQAAHIEAGYEKKGVSAKNSEARAWATVNKLSGGGKKKRLRPEEKLIMPALTAKQIHLHLKAVPHWSKRAQTIVRTFTFEEFLKSIAFVNRIAKKAQEADHHPDIGIRFNKVTLTLTTHDEGGLTEKDFLMARQCDKDSSNYSPS